MRLRTENGRAPAVLLAANWVLLFHWLSIFDQSIRHDWSGVMWHNAAASVSTLLHAAGSVRVFHWALLIVAAVSALAVMRIQVRAMPRPRRWLAVTGASATGFAAACIVFAVIYAPPFFMGVDPEDGSIDFSMLSAFAIGWSLLPATTVLSAANLWAYRSIEVPAHE